MIKYLAMLLAGLYCALVVSIISDSLILVLAAFSVGVLFVAFWVGTNADPVHDKFDEWSTLPAHDFLHGYHAKHVDRSKLVKCEPCSNMVDSRCVYKLDAMCMLDGLQLVAKDKN